MSNSKITKRLSRLENELHVLLTLQTTTDRVTAKQRRAIAVRIVKPNAEREAVQNCYCGGRNSDALTRQRDVVEKPASPQYRTPWVRARSVEAARGSPAIPLTYEVPDKETKPEYYVDDKEALPVFGVDDEEALPEFDVEDKEALPDYYVDKEALPEFDVEDNGALQSYDSDEKGTQLPDYDDRVDQALALKDLTAFEEPEKDSTTSTMTPLCESVTVMPALAVYNQHTVAKKYSQKALCECNSTPPCECANAVHDKPLYRQINQKPNSERATTPPCECDNVVHDKPLYNHQVARFSQNTDAERATTSPCDCNAVPGKPLYNHQVARQFSHVSVGCDCVTTSSCECVNAMPKQPLFDRQAVARQFVAVVEELRRCKAHCAATEARGSELRAQLQTEREAAQKQLESQRLSLELAARLRTKCEELRDAAEQSRSSYESALSEAEARAAAALSELEALSASHSAMLQEAEARSAVALAECEARASARSTLLAEAEASAVAELAEAKARAAAAEAEAEEARRDLEDRTRDLEQSKMAADNMAAEMAVSERRIAELTELLQQDKNRIAELTAMCSQHEASLASVQREMSSKEEDLRAAGQELDAVRRKSSALDDQLKSLRASVQSMELAQAQPPSPGCCACLIKEKVVDDQLDSIDKLKKQLADRTCRLEHTEEALKNVRLQAAELSEDLKMSTQRQTQLRNELREQESCVGDSEQQSKRLRELERMVECKQQEWCDQMQKMRADKCGAVRAAKFATDRLVRTVSELREQTNKCHELRSLMTCALRQKELQLAQAHKEIGKVRQCPSRQQLTANYSSHHRQIRWIPNKRE